MRDPHKITFEDAQAVQDLLSRYPHFQAAYALLAKFAFDRDVLHAGQAVQIAAIYATDRNHLKALLENTLPTPKPVPEAMPVASASEENTVSKVEAYDFVNDYINTIQQKEKRKITKFQSRAQLDSIQAFLERDVDFRLPSLQTVSHEDCPVDLTQESTTFHDDLATETLAQILRKQGRLQRALVIYEKLLLKFPKKRTYFATHIEALKRQV